ERATVDFRPHHRSWKGSNSGSPKPGSAAVTAAGPSTGAVLQTLTAGIAAPISVAFNGERVLVTSGGTAITVWKAADLTPVGSFPIGTGSVGACSDGINFWITLISSTSSLARL